MNHAAADRSQPGHRPSDVCRALLAALDASEGRRRRRKRDQTADAIGLAAKRDLLRRVVAEDPAPEAFEGWLMHYPQTCARPDEAVAALAMARAVFEDWKLAHRLRDFKQWLDEGAPSADVEPRD